MPVFGTWEKSSRVSVENDRNRGGCCNAGPSKKIFSKKAKIMLAFSDKVCYYSGAVKDSSEKSGCGEVWYRA